MATDALSLESLYLGGQPIVQPFLKRLRVMDLIEEALGRSDPRIKLPPGKSAMVMVRNIILSRHPLYGVPGWARRFVPDELDLTADEVRLVNDDRLGRTLDKLFKAGPRSLMTRFVVSMVREFGLVLQRLHNDSTSITFSGEYRDRPPRKDKKRRLTITFGHNKDHRPDLKQLVWSLTVTADGAVPVHYNVYDGNTTDDRTHIETWQVLVEVVGGSDFIYVADCKLCTRENMAYIDGRGGLFVTVLPRTRKEDARFKKWIVENAVPWQIIWKRPSKRRKTDPAEVFEAVEAPEASAEGYRIIWYRSSEKWKLDERARDNAIQRARQDLTRLRERVGRRNLKRREQVERAVEKILDGTGTRAWVHVELAERTRHTHKQERPGRPGKNTRYVRRTTATYEPVFTLDAEAIRAAAAADGIFPLITDIPKDRMSPLEILNIYKYQSFVEKRHEQLKTAAEVVPVNFKSPERIEAFLFLYFIGIVVHALIERHVRDAMKDRGIESIPLYPEERACRAPTAEKILGLFEPLRRNRLFEKGRLLKTFWDPLSSAQRTVLDLLEVPSTAYGQ